MVLVSFGSANAETLGIECPPPTKPVLTKGKKFQYLMDCGEGHFKAHRYVEAEANFQSASEFSDDESEPRYGLAASALMLGRKCSALRLLKARFEQPAREYLKGLWKDQSAVARTIADLAREGGVTQFPRPGWIENYPGLRIKVGGVDMPMSMEKWPGCVDPGPQVFEISATGFAARTVTERIKVDRPEFVLGDPNLRRRITVTVDFDRHVEGASIVFNGELKRREFETDPGPYILLVEVPGFEPWLLRSEFDNQRSSQTVKVSGLKPKSPPPPGPALATVHLELPSRPEGAEVYFRDQLVKEGKPIEAPVGLYVAAARAPGFRPEVVIASVAEKDPQPVVVTFPALTPEHNWRTTVLRWAPVGLFGVATLGTAIWYGGEVGAERQALDRVVAHQRDTGYPMAVADLLAAHDRKERAGWMLTGSATLLAASTAVAIVTSRWWSQGEKPLVSAAVTPGGAALALQVPLQ